MENPKTHFSFGLICGAASFIAALLIDSYKPDYREQVRAKDAEIGRLKLENEMLKGDTINYFTEHSEIVKGN
jgi:hypothetical protein